LRRWIIPRWAQYELGEVRTIEVESWLRSLPHARSTCAEIQNVMSILFNHSMRYELFDSNPIRLVRQSAKRRMAANLLTPEEIKILVDAWRYERKLWSFLQSQPAFDRASCLL